MGWGCRVTLIVGRDGSGCDVGVEFLFLLSRQSNPIPPPLPLFELSEFLSSSRPRLRAPACIKLSIVMAVVVTKLPVFKTWTQGGGGGP